MWRLDNCKSTISKNSYFQYSVESDISVIFTSTYNGTIKRVCRTNTETTEFATFRPFIWHSSIVEFRVGVCMCVCVNCKKTKRRVWVESSSRRIHQPKSKLFLYENSPWKPFAVAAVRLQVHRYTRPPNCCRCCCSTLLYMFYCLRQQRLVKPTKPEICMHSRFQLESFLTLAHRTLVVNQASCSEDVLSLNCGQRQTPSKLLWKIFEMNFAFASKTFSNSNVQHRHEPTPHLPPPAPPANATAATEPPAALIVTSSSVLM